MIKMAEALYMVINMDIVPMSLFLIMWIIWTQG